MKNDTYLIAGRRIKPFEYVHPTSERDIPNSDKILRISHGAFDIGVCTNFAISTTPNLIDVSTKGEFRQFIAGPPTCEIIAENIEWESYVDVRDLFFSTVMLGVDMIMNGYRLKASAIIKEVTINADIGGIGSTCRFDTTGQVEIIHLK